MWLDERGGMRQKGFPRGRCRHCGEVFFERCLCETSTRELAKGLTSTVELRTSAASARPDHIDALLARADTMPAEVAAQVRVIATKARTLLER